MVVENNAVVTVATVSMPNATTRPNKTVAETSTKSSLKRPRPESPSKAKLCGEKAHPKDDDDSSSANPQKPRSTASPETTNSPSNVSPVGTITPGDSDGSSSSSLTTTAANTNEVPPLKSTHFRHLRQKYTSELEYMLREFQKLERQLLGAKGVTTESAGSRERREKLRSFIQHLEDTTQQIQAGCELEAAGKATCPATSAAASESTGLSAQLLTREKQEEENVQKLEEHILANLLPVKVRLKKQLAAQQGARQNPAGMPPIRGSNGGTTAKTAFLKPRATNKTTQQPGSSLTQKLQARAQREAAEASAKSAKDAVSKAPVVKEKKVLYAGMAPGSSQVKSSVQAASSAHNLVIKNPSLLELQTELHTLPDDTGSMNSLEKAEAFAAAASEELALLSQGEAQLSATAQAAILSYEERRKMRRKKRKRRRMLYQQQAAAAAAAVQPKRKKTIQKTGPRSVEYTCGLCNEVYSSTCECNPWWALTRHECQKCRKIQIPRVDISAPANAIEYHPALLAHADDNSAAAAVVPAPEALVIPSPTPVVNEPPFHSDFSDDDLLFSDDDVDDDDDSMFSSSPCSDDSDDGAPMTAVDQAENENFAEYDGPTLVDDEGCRLLALMMHASTCPCRHSNPEHQEVCRGTKWMMLHVRDCPGTTSTYDVCPFPWCRKVKHLLHHVLSCPDPDECQVCSSAALGPNFSRLDGLSQYRLQGFRKKVCHKFGIPVHQEIETSATAAAAMASIEANTEVSSNCKSVVFSEASPEPPSQPLEPPSKTEAQKPTESSDSPIASSTTPDGGTIPDPVASNAPTVPPPKTSSCNVGSENSAPGKSEGPKSDPLPPTTRSASSVKGDDDAVAAPESRPSLCTKQDRNCGTEPQLPSETSIVRNPSLSVIEVSVDP